MLMLASFSLFIGAEAMGIFSIFSKMTQQSINRMNQIKNIPKMHDLMCDDKKAPKELNRRLWDIQEESER
ncbi:hypothetical protein [Treponema vincentii]|uniref:hypothetical protein n=1 Tax=Treponema vincentii TaxID=69710 RepID=UPI0020A380BF|nr:hypothetical protein [Treponema vincentii]UTC49283.1 hypothetical protein E4N73_10790 [Treponema vincentii]